MAALTTLRQNASVTALRSFHGLPIASSTRTSGTAHLKTNSRASGTGASLVTSYTCVSPDS